MPPAQSNMSAAEAKHSQLARQGSMSADSDDADYVFYGTKLQAEEEATSRRHEFQKKDVASAAGSRSLPVWKQVHGCITCR